MSLSMGVAALGLTVQTPNGSGPPPSPPAGDVQTTTVADYVQPAVGATVNVEVVSTANVLTGLFSGVAYVYNFATPNGLGGVYFASPTDATHVDLTNVGGSPYQAPPGLSAAPGETIGAGSVVVFVKNFAELQLLAQVQRLMAAPGAIPTLTRADYVQPAIAAAVNVPVEDVTGYTVGDLVRVDNGGYYVVSDVLIVVGSLRLTNIGNPYNAAPGVVVVKSALVQRPTLASRVTNDSVIANAGEFVEGALDQLASGITGVIWCDPARAQTAPNAGTYGDPFGDLNAAVAAVPVATTAAEMSRFFVVLNCQQESDVADLTIDMTGRRFAVLNLANLSLGQFAMPFGDPSSRRNMNIIGDVAPVDSIDCFFAWTTLANIGGEFFPPADARISGQVIVALTDSSAGSAFPTIELHGDIFGDTGTSFVPSGTAFTDVGTTLADGQITLSLIDVTAYGDFSAAKCAVQVTRCNFPLLALFNLYYWFRQCQFAGNVSAIYCPAGAAKPNESPFGFVQCAFAPSAGVSLGTGTADIHKLVLDADSFNSFVENGIVLTGGTGIVLTSLAAATVLGYGGTLALATQYLVAGGAPNAAAPATQATALTEHVVTRATRLLKLAWNTVAADATTRIDVVVNGVSVTTAALSGASGLLDVDVELAAGDKVALQLTAGTAPSNGSYTIST